MKKRPIYYDTETTGIKVDKDRIIELAAYDPYLDKTFSELINPGIPIPPGATAIHNITDDMVKGAKSFKEVGEAFTAFCEGDVVLIAHNNDSFDQPFLKNEYDRNEIKLPDCKYLDSLKWSRKYRPDLPKHSLQYLRECYGFAANQAHRALDDVVILHNVFSLMLGDLDMDTALELLNVKQKLLHMPFGKHRGKPLKDVPKNYVSWLKDSGAFDKPDNEELKTRFKELDLLS